jgi:hypothetical protein
MASPDRMMVCSGDVTAEAVAVEAVAVEAVAGKDDPTVASRAKGANAR